MNLPFLALPERLGARIAISGLLLLAPLVLVTWILVGEWRTTNGFAVATRDGLTYAGDIRAILDPLAAHRALATQILSETVAGTDSAADLEHQIDVALAHFSETDRALGRELATGDSVVRIISRWQQLKVSWRKLGSVESLNEHDAVADLLLDLHERIGTAANFPLDSKAESYYLLDALGLHLLVITDLSGRLQSRLLTASARTLAPARDQLIADDVRVRRLMDFVETDVARTLSLHDPRSAVIEPAYLRYQAQWSGFRHLSDAAIRNSSVPLPVSDVIQMGDAARTATLELFDSARQAASTVIKDRIDAASRATLVTLTAPLALAVLAIVVGWRLRGQIVRQLSSARQAFLRMEAGDFDTRLVAESRDEIGDVVEALGRMQAVLKQRIEQDRVLAAVADFTDSAVTICAPDGRIEWVNAGFTRLTQLGLGAARGKTAEELLGREVTEPGACVRIRAARAEGRGWGEELASCRADGQEFTALVRAQPVLDRAGSLKGYISIEADLTELKRLERALLNAKDDTLRQLGQEMHDGLGQQLTALMLYASILLAKSRKNETPPLEDFECLIDIGKGAVDTCRVIARGLSPLSASGGDLVRGLRALAADYVAQGQTEVSFTLADNAAPLAVAAPVSDHLFRIAQEAVGNAIKHAEASTITIHAQIAPDTIHLTVADDGRGLPSDLDRSAGLGLRTLRYRAATIGARLMIGPRVGSGTVVRCECPQHANAKDRAA